MIKDAIENYIKDQLSDFAIVMNGDWGCGKTYFIRELLKTWEAKNSFNNIEIIYVSLFGTSSIEDFYKRIYWALNKFEDKFYNKLFAGRFLATHNFNLDLGFLSIGCQNGNVYAEVNGSSMSKDNINEKSKNDLIKLVCGEKNRFYIFDDIERISFGTVNIKEIFGALTNLIDQDNAKVLLICNEAKIEETDESTKSPYFDYKEKFVRHTFNFDPTIEYNGYDNIFDDFVKHFDYLKRFKNNILKVFSKSPKKNLRTLKYIVSTLHTIYKSLTYIETLPEEKETIMKLLINFVVIYIVEQKDGKNKNELDALQNVGHNFTLYLNNQNKKNDYLEKLSNIYTQELVDYHYVPSIAKYINTGILDKEKFKNETEKIYKEYITNESERKMYNSIIYYWGTEDEELKQNVNTFTNYIQKGDFNFIEIVHIYNTLMKLNSLGIDITVDDELFWEECKKRLDKQHGYDENGFEEIDENDKFDRRYNNLIRRCKKHNEEINSKLRNDHFNTIITSITNNKIDDLEGFNSEDSNFLLKIEVDKLFNSLNTANNKTTFWISSVLLKIPYDVYNQYDINKFRDKLNEFAKKNKGKLKSIGPNKLLKQIDNWISQKANP